MRFSAILPAALTSLLLPGADAVEVNDRLVVQIGIHGVGQHANYASAVDENGAALDDATKGAGMFDLVVDFTPTEHDQFYLWARYAKGNALNDVGGVALAPYGGDLEDDVKDINGRNRDYLMEAWYKHTFAFDTGSLGLTAGLIDSTGYIDDNEYANNEETQFMNEAFVNSTNAAFPSYDLGGVAEFERGPWSLRTVYMNTKNDAERSYNYFAAQVGYHPATTLGQGNYRLFAFITNDKFDDASGRSDDERLQGFGLSFDQEFNDTVGGFLRTVWVDDNIGTLYDLSITGGVNINGNPWGRPQDNIGLAYGYLNGPGASDYSSTHVGEAYLRFALNEYLDLSFDVQYEKDNTRASGDDPSAWVFGTRMNVVF